MLFLIVSSLLLHAFWLILVTASCVSRHGRHCVLTFPLVSVSCSILHTFSVSTILHAYSYSYFLTPNGLGAYFYSLRYFHMSFIMMHTAVEHIKTRYSWMMKGFIVIHHFWCSDLTSAQVLSSFRWWPHVFPSRPCGHNLRQTELQTEILQTNRREWWIELAMFNLTPHSHQNTQWHIFRVKMLWIFFLSFFKQMD